MKKPELIGLEVNTPDGHRAPPSINKGEKYEPSDDLPGGHPAS